LRKKRGDFIGGRKKRREKAEGRRHTECLREEPSEKGLRGSFKHTKKKT
jgi:hypothetical protein